MKLHKIDTQNVPLSDERQNPSVEYTFEFQNGSLEANVVVSQEDLGKIHVAQFLKGFLSTNHKRFSSMSQVMRKYKLPE
jgi:hypothetical protein